MKVDFQHVLHGHQTTILDSLEARFQAGRYNDADEKTRARDEKSGMKTLFASVLLVILQADGTFFTTDRSVEEMETKQAVVETSMGTFVIGFLPRVAPNHVGYFLKLASEGAYDGTTFHRVIKYGIIQGGDPLTKDENARARYGTGGLGVLKAEFNDESHTRGAVSAVRIPGKPDSAGSQFFICVTDQPSLDGQYTVFGRVLEGIDVVQAISETPADDKTIATERVEILSVTVRDAPSPESPMTPNQPETEAHQE
jgi:cyclophilin family peptidyl-prolyl cis-trans isomerase